MNDNSPTDSYKSISKSSTGIYKELGSKFLSFAFPVSSEDEINSILSELRKSYFDAKHHCYAYRLGINGDLWRANDDGEPPFSAGKPILGQLLSKEISDVLVVVVRYFGGTKLGIPGLIKAYKYATSDAIKNTEIVEKVVCADVSISFDYLLMNQIMKIIKEFSATILEQQFDNLCKIKVNIRQNCSARFIEAIEDVGGAVKTS